MGETSKSSSSNPPAIGKNTFHEDRLVKFPSNLTLNSSRDWAIYGFPGQPVPVSHDCHHKEFLLGASKAVSSPSWAGPASDQLDHLPLNSLHNQNLSCSFKVRVGRWEQYNLHNSSLHLTNTHQIITPSSTGCAPANTAQDAIGCLHCQDLLQARIQLTVKSHRSFPAEPLLKQSVPSLY